MAGPRLSALGVCRASAAAYLLVSSLSGCGGDVVNLGTSGTLSLGGDAGSGGSAGSSGSGNQGGTESVGWQSVSLVLPHPSDVNLSFANGTLTSVPNQPTQLYFTQQLRGVPESFIRRAEQSDIAWSTPNDLSFGGEVVDDASSPAISLAGHQLWFGSRRDGSSSTDIWLCTGTDADTWSVPEKIVELNSDADDAPRQPAVQGSIMPLSSKRHGGKYYQIYFAERDAEDQPWRAPTQTFLGTINSPNYESGDAFLTLDGLTLYFSSTRDGSADLFRARRVSLGEPFGEPQALGDVNSPDFDERDPWLRESDQQLFFTSNRSGILEIYSAEYRP